ncbi:MAG: lysophospholipid acyltransferase family protein [Chthoniobacterales bacterium]
MRPAWKQVRYRLEWIAVSVAAVTVPWLPRVVCYWIAQIIGAIAAGVDRRGRRVALSNLAAAFGDSYSEAQRARIVTDSYQHFARTMIDLLWSPRLTPETFRESIDVSGIEQSLAAIEPTRSCVFVTFHYGNFEWAAKAMGFCGVPLLILTQEFKNPLLDPIFGRLRQHSGHEIAAREGAIIRMFKALKHGKHVAILSDLTLPLSQPNVFIDCFGLKTCVTFAHARLHRRTGAPLVPVIAEPLPGGRCRVLVQPQVEFAVDATETEIAQACWERFESVVRKNPAPWLWMYKHWRYRFSVSDPRYPFYAEAGPTLEARLVRQGRLGSAKPPQRTG